jgi:hypothetical protein
VARRMGPPLLLSYPHPPFENGALITSTPTLAHTTQPMQARKHAYQLSQERIYMVKLQPQNIRIQTRTPRLDPSQWQ